MLSKANPINSFGPQASEFGDDGEQGSDQPDLAFAQCLNDTCNKARESEKDESDPREEKPPETSQHKQEPATDVLPFSSIPQEPTTRIPVGAVSLLVADLQPIQADEVGEEASQSVSKNDLANFQFSGKTSISPEHLLVSGRIESSTGSNQTEAGTLSPETLESPREPKTGVTAGGDTKDQTQFRPTQVGTVSRETSEPPKVDQPSPSAELVLPKSEPTKRVAGQVESWQAKNTDLEFAVTAPSEGNQVTPPNVLLQSELTQGVNDRQKKLNPESSKVASAFENMTLDAGQPNEMGLDPANPQSPAFSEDGGETRQQHDLNPKVEPTHSEPEHEFSKFGEPSIAFSPEIQSSGQVNEQNSLIPLEPLMLDFEQPAATGLGAQVIQQVVDQISSPNFDLSQIESGEGQLKIQIYPEQLGQLEITVTTGDDGMVAQITASEMITSELLNREKAHLVEALSEKGMSFPNIDISHQNSEERQHSEFQQERWSPWGRESKGPDRRSQLHPLSRSARTSSMIDMLV